MGFNSAFKELICKRTLTVSNVQYLSKIGDHNHTTDPRSADNKHVKFQLS